MAARRLLTFATAGVALALAAPLAHADTIRVQSTTDTIDAGLLDGLLRDAYARAQPGDTLDYVGVGTGRALDNARAGLADVVITHAPSLEKVFVQQGFSLESAGRAIFYSDYVIAGPQSDPAGVAAKAPHDAIGALEAIAEAGADGRASFTSRGDNSGTNVQEQLMWGLTDSSVTKSQGSNAGSDARRFEPTRTAGAVGDYPTWYGKANRGQAATLELADVCPTATFPNGNCYVMVDRGTFNRLFNSGRLTTLRIVSQNNAADARGGKDLLINPFSAYIVKPEAVADRYTVNVPAARRFIDFLVSPSFQAAVDTWPTATDPAFRGDAYPSVRAILPLSPTATAGSAVTISLAFANKQPGTPVVTGMPVQLQQSTDNGATWTNAGAPQPTDVAGNATFAPTIAGAPGAVTRYRVSLPDFQATDWNMFTASVQDVGAVSVVATPAPTPIDERRPQPAPADRTAPRASKAKLAARGLTLRVNEPATVAVTVTKRTVRRVGRGRRARTVVRWVKVRSGSTRARKAGTVTLRWGRALGAGRYRVALRLRDDAGNRRTQTITVTLKAQKRAARR